MTPGRGTGSACSTYPEVVSIDLDGELQFPQPDERGRRAREVGDAVDHAGNLPTKQLLLVKQGLWGRSKSQAGS